MNSPKHVEKVISAGQAVKCRIMVVNSLQTKLPWVFPSRHLQAYVKNNPFVAGG